MLYVLAKSCEVKASKLSPAAADRSCSRGWQVDNQQLGQYLQGDATTFMQVRPAPCLPVRLAGATAILGFLLPALLCSH